MPQLEKTLHGDLDEINRKIAHGICSISPLTNKRGSWTTTIGDVRCIFTVFEKHAKKVYRDGEWQAQPHYSLSLNLIDTGEEIRLCAITAGSSQDMYFTPYSGAEGELMDALNITLAVLDNII